MNLTHVSAIADLRQTAVSGPADEFVLTAED